MEEHATALADAVVAALPGWVERSVARILTAWRPGEAPAADVVAQAQAAGARAAEEVGARVRTLLAADIDDQRTTPLALLRDAVSYPTAVLRAAGVAEVERDPIQVRLLPDDPYDLSPATFADVDPSLAEPGMVWGAAKALAHRRRHAT
ncbi:MAG: hypothetical protein M3066_15760 [Actinomycetota bacterium]|nr:hypothetical protein [Actinomycetota bacterium]